MNSRGEGAEEEGRGRGLEEQERGKGRHPTIIRQADSDLSLATATPTSSPRVFNFSVENAVL